VERILTVETEMLRKAYLFRFVNHKSHMNLSGLEPVPRGGKPAITRLNCGTALLQYKFLLYLYIQVNLPQNGLREFVGTMKLPLPVAFMVSKPIGTQFCRVHFRGCTMCFVAYPRVSRLWKEKYV
jgi:hypothetical protein